MKNKSILLTLIAISLFSPYLTHAVTVSPQTVEYFDFGNGIEFEPSSVSCSGSGKIQAWSSLDSQSDTGWNANNCNSLDGSSYISDVYSSAQGNFVIVEYDESSAFEECINEGLQTVSYCSNESGFIDSSNVYFEYRNWRYNGITIMPNSVTDDFMVNTFLGIRNVLDNLWAIVQPLVILSIGFYAVTGLIALIRFVIKDDKTLKESREYRDKVEKEPRGLELLGTDKSPVKGLREKKRLI